MEVAREEQELVPGGDIRIRGNSWLRQAFSKSRIKRVPREGEFRKVRPNCSCKKGSLSLRAYHSNIYNFDLSLFRSVYFVFVCSFKGKLENPRAMFC